MEMTVENVSIADLMAKKGAEEATKKIEEVLTADKEVNALIEAAQTVEDAYDAVKRCLNLTLEEFKIIFQKTVDYFKEDKEVIGDEVLNSVSGGGFWGDAWNYIKKPLLAVAVFAGCMVAGVAIGAATGGVVGAGVGALAGFTVGIVSAIKIATT